MTNHHLLNDEPKLAASKDHGGDIDRAIEIYGSANWLDLSTGINPCPYPTNGITHEAWARLPSIKDRSKLEQEATHAYRTSATAIALPGAQTAIQLVPQLCLPPKGQHKKPEARILSPTYNEHAHILHANGWNVIQVNDFVMLEGAFLAVVVNPNNPDGRFYTPQMLLELARKVTFLVVDESFADPTPELSIAPYLNAENNNILVLRSFGKFYGLAGIRLGFVLSHNEKLIHHLRQSLGPWPISGPAIALGCLALADEKWHQKTCYRLQQDSIRLDNLARQAGWQLVGGTLLFRTYKTANALHAQHHLAKHHIWSRIFPYSSTWVRLGLAKDEDEWQRLSTALQSVSLQPV